MSRKILFIVNPNAGKKKATSVIRAIRSALPGREHYEVVIWKDKDNFATISEKILTGSFTDAVAVGGDVRLLLLRRERPPVDASEDGILGDRQQPAEVGRLVWQHHGERLFAVGGSP